MADVVVSHPTRGLDRVWVPRVDEDYWIRFWSKHGIPAARWRDYKRWGGSFFPPTSDDVIRGKVMSPRTPRRRTNYRRWHAPHAGY